MAYYENPSDMFNKRAEQKERSGKSHWRQAREGEGDENYGLARNDFNEAERLRNQAEEYSGLTWDDVKNNSEDEDEDEDEEDDDD